MTRYSAPLVAAAMLLAVACSSGADGEQEVALDTAAAAMVETPEAMPAPALDDATIVAIFDAANTADIETGQLAAERGSTQAVRDFGAMLVRDHTTVRQQGRDLATKLGVTPTPPADDASARAHAEVMASLQALQGAEFDKAFLAHEAKFHEDVIGAVQSTLLPAIQNAEVKGLVEQVVPAFNAHMVAAQNMQMELAGS